MDGARPLPPEVQERFAAALRRHHAACCWFWDPQTPIATEDDARALIRQLRANGGKQSS